MFENIKTIVLISTAGSADPGRAPNYSKTYLIDRVDDQTIAHEVLAILHDVYGYTGLPNLKIITEETHH
jgi:hypothetical protein